MKGVSLFFFGATNDLLKKNLKNQWISVEIDGLPAVKHLIESLGVPHVEVGGITANDQAVRLNYHVQPGDLIRVYPPSTGIDIEPRFLLDNHLGKLAVYLRMLGFDSLYRNDYDDAKLAALINHDQRILLTRDRRLLMRKVVEYGYCLRSLDPTEQLIEVVNRFELTSKVNPFHRCLLCNHPLKEVQKELILDRLEPLTKRYYDEFVTCTTCDKVFWKGSHHDRMQRLIDRVTQT